MTNLDLHNRHIARLERENAVLRRTLDVLSRAGDIESAQSLARGVLGYLGAAERERPDYVLIPIEDERAAQLCEQAALRLRRDIAAPASAAVETIACVAIDAERQARDG